MPKVMQFMTTLLIDSRAAMLRAISQPGITIRVLSHWQEPLRGTTRTPKAVRNGGKRGIQTNGYYFDGPRENHMTKQIETTEMWADIPPASKLRFNPDGSVTFHPDTDRSWTLSFEQSA